MKTYKAIVLKVFGSEENSYVPGSELKLIESNEYQGYYWIVENGKLTRNLISNNSGELFRIIDEIKKVS